MNLDFSTLRIITGGNAMVESELFQIFLESSHECLTFLREACRSNDEGVWRTQAHAFKGISFAIGAEDLGRLCKEAQENCMRPLDYKRQMLVRIEKEFTLVENELKGKMVH
jgi:HPt (histidine-containing phosphotransfer) domain-containing protein